MNDGDAATKQAILGLQERMERTDAETVKLQGQVKALGGRVVALESAQPSPAKPKIDVLAAPDRDVPSEAERAEMRERLRDRTNTAARENAEYHRKRAAKEGSSE